MRSIVLPFLFGIAVLLSSAPLNRPNVRIRTIIIDAGHGGKDPGAIARGVKEKNITLAVALKLGKIIKQQMPEVKVIFTRTTDRFIPLEERSAIANRNQGNLFISIHCNSLPSKPSVAGTETYVLGMHKSKASLEVAKRENRSITFEEDYQAKYEGFDPNSEEAYIIFSLYQHEFLAQSITLGSLIEKQMQRKTRRRSRGVRQAGFLVLWRTQMPSVLTEIGFLTNPGDNAFLRSSKGQQQVAESIFAAIRAYKTREESQ